MYILLPKVGVFKINVVKKEPNKIILEFKIGNSQYILCIMYYYFDLRICDINKIYTLFKYSTMIRLVIEVDMKYLQNIVLYFYPQKLN